MDTGRRAVRHWRDMWVYGQRKESSEELEWHVGVRTEEGEQ